MIVPNRFFVISVIFIVIVHFFFLLVDNFMSPFNNIIKLCIISVNFKLKIESRRVIVNCLGNSLKKKIIKFTR